MSPVRQSPEITPEELVRTVESGAPMRVLDVRAPGALSEGRIDIVPSDRFLNVRGSEILAMGEAARGLFPQDGPIAVVCGRGNSSRQVAAVLRELGIEAASVRGGMAAWALSVVARPLAPPPGFDHFIQFDRVAKGAVGYLLGSRGEAILIDPPRKAQPFLERARELGLRVIGVADTHVHADYLSGGPGLSHSLQIPYYLHPRDAVSPFDGAAGRIRFEPLEEGGVLRVGGGEVRIAHTPGHTEGSVTFLAGGEAALTGDFIFVGSIGRPDLGGKAEAWTRELWSSVDRARREWAGDLRIHPAHYAGEAEREADHTVGRTFGKVRDANAPLQIADEASFIDWVLSKVGTSPESYRKIKLANLGLIEVWDTEAQELETGRNECALA